MNSSVQMGEQVTFPDNTGERIYMLPFHQKDGLPTYLSRWQKTVDAMLDGVKTDDSIYLMIDQGIVKRGSAHRRPGLHVDGNWNESSGRHDGHRHGDYGVEMIILASDVKGCRALIGDVDGTPGPEGQCHHLDVAHLDEMIFEPFRSYFGTATTVHESLPMLTMSARSLVRLNVPGVNL